MMNRTLVRAIAACPACGARRGENCRRVREHRSFGWVRIANHQERIDEAMRTRYTLDANTGLLVDRKGETLGRVVSLTIDSSPLATTERVGNGERCCCSLEAVDPVAVEKDQPLPHTPRPTATQLERESTLRVWAYWLEVSGKQQRLDSKRERIIRNAVRLVDEENVKRALLGLTRSPHHNGQNEQRRKYLEVRYALKGIGDESDDERIEKAITWAAMYAPEAQNVDPAKVQRDLDAVRYTLGLEHRPERDRALAAWKRLKDSGFTVVRLSQPPWARLER